MSDGFDILAGAGVIVLAVGLGMLAPWLAWAVLGLVMIGMGIFGARLAEQAGDTDQTVDEDES